MSHQQQQKQSIATREFGNPEDFVDITGTPWIFVSEFYGEPIREETGSLSLYNTKNNHRVPFSVLKASNRTDLSPLAKPACNQRELDSISPHGVDAYDNGDGTW